jgi:undecaprenyl-diphosphatase
MSIFEAIILGAVQGITEFLPISSSGHLVIFEHFMGLHVEDLVEFDIMLHLGTVFSILIFFNKDIAKLIKAIPSWFLFIFKGFKRKNLNNEIILINYLLIGTIPAGLVGVLFADNIASLFRSPASVGFMMLFTAVLFIFAEFVYKRKRKFHIENTKEASKLSFSSAIFIGLMQALALIPGVSRSGSTISAGIITGLKREEAARFSFFLGSIAILGASIIIIKDIDFSSGLIFPIEALILGFLSSFIFGILSIGILMKILKKHPLWIFSIYLVIVSAILYWL